jgi:hypothetical protein
MNLWELALLGNTGFDIKEQLAIFMGTHLYNGFKLPIKIG